MRMQYGCLLVDNTGLTILGKVVPAPLTPVTFFSFWMIVFLALQIAMTKQFNRKVLRVLILRMTLRFLAP
jgi:hypothetical protein